MFSVPRPLRVGTFLKQHTQLDASMNRKISLLCRTHTAKHVSSIRAHQTAVAASGFRMNVEVVVFSADHLHIHTETRACNGSSTGS
jgi:hypothetical protein